MLETWALLESQYIDWKLTIIGDGPDRDKLKRQAGNLNLKRIAFEGFQDPVDYYKRASILLLTSDFEGFPLVLAECMSFGVVPCVYGSYSAVYDIIEDKVNGLILSARNGEFIKEDMARMVSEIMKDSTRLHKMTQKAMETSKAYSIDSVYEQWLRHLYAFIN